MPLVTQSVKNLISGISQQPQVLRFPEQLQEQKNGMSSGANGLRKRPPTLHVKKITIPSESANPYIHTIERDSTEKYIVAFTKTGVLVWDTQGNPKTVTYDTGTQSYLNNSNPRRSLKVITIADYTFVANTEVIVRMGSALTPGSWTTQGVLFHVKGGQYGRTYSCMIDGVEIMRYTTPDGSHPEDTNLIDTNSISWHLQQTIIAGYTIIAVGEGWMYVKKNSGSISTVTTYDGYNNQSLFGFLHTTQKFSLLPATAPHGFCVLVKGDSSTNSDDYYVTYNATEGVWKESAKPGIPLGFDPTTMPHTLVRQSDGTFKFGVADWDDREIGDEDSNPPPSFVDSTINDIFFIRNRLGFLSGENVIMSKSGFFFKFWMSSATTVVDSDTIDSAVPDESIAILKHAVPFNEELLLFSDRAQFIGQSDSIFSPKNFRLDRTTKFDCLPYCKPVGAGRRIYFPRERAEFSSLMEYYIVEDVTSVKDAHDITSHVPSFILNSVHKIIGNTSEDLLLLFSDGAPNKLYVYKYLWQEEQRVQSSWSYWQFDSANILGGGLIGSDLYLVLTRGTETWLEKMVFTYDTIDYPSELYRAFMDRKTTYVVPPGSFDVNTGMTTINAEGFYGVPLPATNVYGVITSDGIYKTVANSVPPSDSTYTAPKVVFNGNLEGTTLIVGELMEFVATTSELMVKTDDGKGGVKANNKGRLQLRTFRVNYDESGYFLVRVSHKGKCEYTYEMTGRVLGNQDNVFGSLPVDSGVFPVPIQGDSRDITISIESNAPSAISLIGYEWEGNHVERTAR